MLKVNDHSGIDIVFNVNGILQTMWHKSHREPNSLNTIIHVYNLTYLFISGMEQAFPILMERHVDVT